MKMKMNSKTAGIFFLFVCLFIVLFIGQWSNSRGGSNSAYLGQMESFTEGKVGRTTHPKTTHHTIATTKKPTIVGAPNPGQTTKKTERFSNLESFTEGKMGRTTHPKTTHHTIATTKKPMIVGAPIPGQTTKKTERFSNLESFTEGGRANKISSSLRTRR